MADSAAPALKAAIIRDTEFDQYSENLFPGGVLNPRMHGLISYVLGLMRSGACAEDLAACAELGLGPVDEDTDLRLLQAAIREHQASLDPQAVTDVVYSDDTAGAGTFASASPAGNIATLQRAALPARVTASWMDGATAQGALARFNALPGVPMEVVIGATTHLGGLHADPFAREAFTVARPSPVKRGEADPGLSAERLDGTPLMRRRADSAPSSRSTNRVNSFQSGGSVAIDSKGALPHGLHSGDTFGGSHALPVANLFGDRVLGVVQWNAFSIVRV